MPMHVNAFTGSPTFGSGLVQLTAAADPIIHPLNLGIQIPGTSPQGPGLLNQLLFTWSLGTNAIRTQLQSPSIRDQPFPTFEPVNRQATTPNPIRIHEFIDDPLMLAAFEELDAFGANSVATTPIWHFTILADAIPTPIKSPNLLHVRWSAAATLVGNQWNAFAPVFDQQLIVGNYAVVGGYTQSATALAWRLVPASGNVFRPGSPAFSDSFGFNSRYFRNGYLGQWMVFNSLTPPQIEVYATGADTTEEGVLDLLPL